MVWFVLWSIIFGFACFLVYAGSLPEWTQDLFAMPSNVLGWTEATVGQTMANGVLTIGCTIGVFIFYYLRFNAWTRADRAPSRFPEHTPRFFTTWLRYSSWAFFYGALMALCFLVVVFIPEFVEKITTLLGVVLPGHPFLDGLGTTMLAPPDRAADQVWFLTSALMVAVLFAKSEFEQRLREFFQTRAMIPHQAEQIFDQLKDDYFTAPLPPDDRRDFIRHSHADRRMPSYYEFELVVEPEQQLQYRLELLPRVEFMIWRMKRRGFSPEIDLELMRHEEKMADVERAVLPLREAVGRINTQLMQVIDGLQAIELAASRIAGQAAAGGGVAIPLGAMDRVRAAAGLGGSDEPLRAIPVSRLDDVAEALQKELDGLSKRLADLNATAFGALQEAALDTETRAVDTVARLGVAVGDLRGQIQALLDGLAPLCGFGLKTLDDMLEGRHDEMKQAAERTLAFAICVALAGSRRPEHDFFERLGLAPRLGQLRFRVDRALWLILGQFLTFAMLLFVIKLVTDPEVMRGLASARTMAFDWADPWIQAWAGWLDGQMPRDRPRDSFIAVPIWLVVGGWFICGALLHGCYHGSAIASMRSIRNGRHRPRGFRLTDCAVAYALIWPISVIGLYAITSGFNIPNVFAGAAPFTLVPAIWGVVTAAATMRALLDLKPITFWRDAALTVAAVMIALSFIYVWTDATGVATLGPLMWAIVVLMALVLSLGLLVTIRLSVERTDSVPRAVFRRGPRGAQSTPAE